MRHILILFSSSDVISHPFLPFLPYNRGIGLRDSFISIFNFNHHKIHKRPATRPQFVYHTKINSEIIIIIIIYYYCSLDVISHSSPSSPSPPPLPSLPFIHSFIGKFKFVSIDNCSVLKFQLSLSLTNYILLILLLLQ